MTNINHDNFCIMPFVNIILEPDGNIGFCRQKGTEFTFGNIRNKSIWELWNCTEVKNWRNEFIYDKVSICKDEFHNKACHKCPQLNSLLPKTLFNEVQPNRILRLTANFNGKCNLECQMCDVWKLPNNFYTEENFWQPARSEIFPTLEEIDMLSGEPFIQPDTYKLIDEVSAINKKCQWSITTNAHWKLTPKIKQKLNKITFKNLIISLDSLDSVTYSKIRRKGKLDFVLANIDQLITYQNERIKNGLSSLNFKVNFLVQKDNWLEVPNLLAFCREKKLSPFITFLVEPKEFSLINLTLSERLEVVSFYITKVETKNLNFLRRVLVPLFSSLKNGEEKGLR